MELIVTCCLAGPLETDCPGPVNGTLNHCVAVHWHHHCANVAAFADTIRLE